MELSYKQWGEYAGEPLFLFRLTAADGAYVELTNLGATWVSACMPDARGRLADVLLGYPSAQGYIDDTCYIGTTVGRYANRIARARVVIGGVEYRLDANDGVNTNHGGFHGWNRRVWGWQWLPQGIRFTLVSPHLEGGFPGEVHAEVDYCFDDSHNLSICHRAVTDRDTCINMTNHAYFNLSGNARPVDDHLRRPAHDAPAVGVEPRIQSLLSLGRARGYAQSRTPVASGQRAAHGCRYVASRGFVLLGRFSSRYRGKTG